jgi:uncharacterized membrane protein YgcG
VVAGYWLLVAGDTPQTTSNQQPATTLATHLHCCARMGNLLWLIIVILIVLWLVGGFALNIGGNLIHILLVIALILVVYRLATGRKVL